MGSKISSRGLKWGSNHKHSVNAAPGGRHHYLQLALWRWFNFAER